MTTNGNISANSQQQRLFFIMWMYRFSSQQYLQRWYFTSCIINIFLSVFEDLIFNPGISISSYIKNHLLKHLKIKTMKTIRQFQKFFTSEFWNFAAPSNFGWAYNS